MTTHAIIKVRFQVEGFHAWPGAPQHRDYLRSRHRHLFHFQVECEVSHDDRQLEFHDLLVAAKGRTYANWGTGMPKDTYDFGQGSCEMIARALLVDLTERTWPIVAVEVWEDGECGARVEVVE